MRKICMFLIIAIIFSVMFLPVVLMSTQTQQRSQKVVIEVENDEQIDLYEGSYALLIGASRYTNGWSNLNGVNVDINKVAAVLKEHGFQVEVLLDPTRELLDSTMRKFIGSYGIKAGNRLLVYYAGHGHTEKNNGSNLGYIVPVDAPLPKNDLGGFIGKAISMNEIQNYAIQIRSKHALFIFDSCFSGTLFEEKRGKVVPPVISSKTALPVRQFITAGTAEQEVPDNSIFCQQFVEALEGEADLDGNGFITGTELGVFLETQVTNYSNSSQTPRYRTIPDSNLSKGDFVFALAKPIVAATKPKPEIEIEREIPLGTLVVIANKRDMEILLDTKIVAKSQAAGEKITIKNIEAGKPVEIIGRVKGEKDIVETIELIAGAKTEITLGKIIVNNNSNGINNATSNASALPAYKPAGTAVAPLMKTYSYNTVELDGNGNVRNTPERKGSYYEEDLGRGIKLEMIEVVGGTFMMGSPSTEANRSGDEGPQHEVKVPTFYIGKYEVTQGQWKVIMGKNLSHFKGDDNFPVEQVSWNDAVEFCKKLSAKTGREYRLPSEAEWEYAARGGTTTAFGYGETINANIVNYNGNYPYGEAGKGEYREKTIRVGSFAPNGYGLYEMHGNVWEWCQDSWHDSYNNAPKDGGVWRTGADNSLRVVRGGSWSSNAYGCRSAYRVRGAPDVRVYNVGFRIVASARTLK